MLEYKDFEVFTMIRGFVVDTFHAINNSFESFLNEHLKSGLAGFLQLPTTCFVWDQGFIAGQMIIIIVQQISKMYDYLKECGFYVL